MNTVNKIFWSVGISILVLLFVVLVIMNRCDDNKTTTGKTVSVVEKKSEDKNVFTAEVKAKLKNYLIDSLKGMLKPQLRIVYENTKYNLDSLIAEAKREALESLKTEDGEIDSTAKMIFTSTADTTIVFKDTTGRTRDSIIAQSTFESPIPLHSASQHLFSFEHHSFNYDKETTIKETTFLKSITPVITAAYGYGLRSAQWDVFVGAGIKASIEDIFKLIVGE